jgi:RNase P protein component
MELSNSFQIAIYENLIEELKKTKQFQQVFRDGDLKANETRHLLTLKTNVEKYTPGSETRRAVTTVSGATKLMVRTQLVTREGKVVLERTVNGQVRFFGSNMRATHNLARNVAKAIKQSSRADLDQPADTLAGQL